MEEKKVTKKRKPKIKCDYRVKLYEDGKYHWMYDLKLLKNPAVFFEVYWVLGITMLIFFCIMFLIQACESGLSDMDFGLVLEITGITAAIMAVLGLLGYLLYAALSGWKYSVHFIMDEKGVVHKQAASAQKVAKGIGFLTVLAALASKRPGVAGAGMLASSRTEMSSDFFFVRRVKAVKWMNTIKVNERFSRNRVFVDDADFDFVYNYICSRCPNAKIG